MASNYIYGFDDWIAYNKSEQWFDARYRPRNGSLKLVARHLCENLKPFTSAGELTDFIESNRESIKIAAKDGGVDHIQLITAIYEFYEW